MPIAIYRLLGQPGALAFGQAMAMATLLMVVIGVAVVVFDRAARAGTGGAVMLSLENVTRSLRVATIAVDGVSLEVRDGERLSVLGPSGSGKSTLLRAIAGLEPLAAGSIKWDGHDLADVPVHRRGFGLMFQDYVLFPHLDVAGNVGFGLTTAARSATIDRGRAWPRSSSSLGWLASKNACPTQLSGGEQQRVALARALAPRPRLLMLDEPLGALDRALRRSLLDELVGCCSRGWRCRSST